MSSEEIPAQRETAPASEAETGSAPEERDELDLTDPKAMRALAHPVRMALLELIGVTGTLTATQASEALGESPANCAFHLRTLGKYGFVAEAGGGKGRERPWKLVNSNIRLSIQHQSPDTALAARTTQQIWLERIMRRARQILCGDELPEGWRGSAQASQNVQFLTPAEATQLNADVNQLTTRYEERMSDPAKRPEGSLPVELLYFAYPLAHLADVTANGDG